MVGNLCSEGIVDCSYVRKLCFVSDYAIARQATVHCNVPLHDLLMKFRTELQSAVQTDCYLFQNDGANARLLFARMN